MSNTIPRPTYKAPAIFSTLCCRHQPPRPSPLHWAGRDERLCPWLFPWAQYSFYKECQERTDDGIASKKHMNIHI